MFSSARAPLAAIILALCGMTSVATAQTAQTAPPPLAAYSQLPAVSSVQLSPDGANIASIRREAGNVRVVALSREGDLLASVEVGDSQVRGVMWASNDHVLILSTSNQQAGGFRGRNIFTIGDILNVRTGRLVRALNDADISVYNFLMSYDRVVRNGRPGLVVTGLTTHEGEYTGDPYLVDLDTGRESVSAGVRAIPAFTLSGWTVKPLRARLTTRNPGAGGCPSRGPWVGQTFAPPWPCWTRRASPTWGGPPAPC